MSRRVFVEKLVGSSIRIDDAEAHHLLHVLRMGSGDSVELFDGQGRLAEGRIDHVSRREVTVTVVSRRQAPESSLPRLTVAVAPAKGDRLKWMVEKLTELGVHQLILLQTDRTIVRPGDAKIEKLRATVIGACRQSLRPRLMHLRSLVKLSDLLQERNTAIGMSTLFLAHPESTPERALPPSEVAKPGTAHTSDESLLLIGPEGGFTDEEVQLIRSHGARNLSWPDTILRIETAAVLFASQLLHQLLHQQHAKLWQ